MKNQDIDFDEIEERFSVSDGEAFYYFCRNLHSDPSEEFVDEFQEYYVGRFDDFEDYAYVLARDSGMMENIQFMQKYFNHKAFARDLLAGGDAWFEEANTEVIVFEVR